MKATASIGSISSGTMRTEDLLEAFSYTLDGLAPKNPKHDHRKLIKEYLDSLERPDDTDLLPDEELLEAFFDALNEYAPAYCYFGAHEGEGADYGFWPSIDALEDDARYGEVLKVNDTSEVPSAYRGYVMHVNDHGNVTLYNKTSRHALREIWGCV